VGLNLGLSIFTEMWRAQRSVPVGHKAEGGAQFLGCFVEGGCGLEGS